MPRLTLVLLPIAVLAFASSPTVAVTTTPKFAVGSCEPTLQSYPTIQIAVNKVPAGSIVLVCPGPWPEQVTITQPLTLQGVQIGGDSASVITVPSNGFTQNTTSESGFPSGPPAPVAAQILVQNTAGPVNISHLIVDGSGGSFSGGYLVGVYYQEASGTLSSSVVKNQQGTGTGLGVVLESFTTSQNASVQNCTIHDFASGGIFANTAQPPLPPSLNMTVQSNVIRGTGGTLGIAVNYATGTVSSNSILEVAKAFWLIQSSLNVTSNTASTVPSLCLGCPGAILVESGTNTLKSNHLVAGGDIGVFMFNNTGTAMANTIQSNTFVNSTTAILGCTGSATDDATGNTVTNNKIMDATTGLSMPSGNTIVPNTYIDVATAVSPCS